MKLLRRGAEVCRSDEVIFEWVEEIVLSYSVIYLYLVLICKPSAIADKPLKL